MTDLHLSAEDKLYLVKQKLKDFDSRIGSRTKAIKVFFFSYSPSFDMFI